MSLLQMLSGFGAEDDCEPGLRKGPGDVCFPEIPGPCTVDGMVKRFDPALNAFSCQCPSGQVHAKSLNKCVPLGKPGGKTEESKGGVDPAMLIGLAGAGGLMYLWWKVR